MDAVELLRHDHRMVEQLFRDYWAARSDGQRRAVVEVAVRELSKLAVLEELMVYPMAQKVLPGWESAAHVRLAAHLNIKKTAIALNELERGDGQTDVLMAKLEGESSSTYASMKATCCRGYAKYLMFKPLMNSVRNWNGSSRWRRPGHNPTLWTSRHC